MQVTCSLCDTDEKDNITLSTHIKDVVMTNFLEVPGSEAYTQQIVAQIQEFFVHDNHSRSPYRELTGPLSYFNANKKKHPELISLILKKRMAGNVTHLQIMLNIDPLFIQAYQFTLDFLFTFLSPPASTQSMPQAPIADSEQANIVDGRTIVFDEINIQPLEVIINYKPSKEDTSNITRGNFVWMFSMIPLSDAKFTLPEVHLYHATDMQVLESIGNIYQPNLGTNVLQYLTGVTPVRIILKVGEGMAEIVRRPIKEARGPDGVVVGVGKGVGLGIQSFTVEILTGAVKAGKATSSFLRKFTGQAKETQELTSNPDTFMSGTYKAFSQIAGGLYNGVKGLTVQPYTEYQTKGTLGFASALCRGIPGVVLSPAAGIAEACASFSTGLRNSLDSSRITLHKKKYKSSINM
eukprot:gene6746-7841_t